MTSSKKSLCGLDRGGHNEDETQQEDLTHGGGCESSREKR